MYCPNCGEGIYLIDSFNNIKLLFCEDCEKVHSVCIHEDAAREVESMKASYFQQEIRNSERPRIGYSTVDQVKMHDPNNRIKLAPGEFRVRYTCRNKGA
jgi:ribosomal protein L44E